MDSLIDRIEDSIVLPYDDPAPADLNSSTTAADSGDGTGRSLADRISSTKVYLLSDASKPTRVGKRRREEDQEEDAPGDVDMDEGESPIRDNAILLHGAPISHLPTTNIFAYATHFDASPMGLEWIDDTTCILVFESKGNARTAFRTLQKSLAEEPSREDNTVTAKPIPIAIWPAQDRINATLGTSEGLKGILRMRWARTEDVKKRGANKESEFYKKYGQDAGKTFEEGPPPPKKRRPGNDSHADAQERAKLDDELDRFLAEDEDAAPPSPPPSKMRSDYMDKDGRTLLERTSQIRAHPTALESRLTAGLPRRARADGGAKRGLEDRFSDPPTRRGRESRDSRERTRERRPPRPKATQEELDAELDAFLNAKD